MAIQDEAAIQKVVDASDAKSTVMVLYAQLQKDGGVRLLSEGLSTLEIFHALAVGFKKKWGHSVEKYRCPDRNLKAYLVGWILKYPNISSRHVENIVREIGFPINNGPFRKLFAQAASSARAKHVRNSEEQAAGEWVPLREVAKVVGRTPGLINTWARSGRIRRRATSVGKYFYNLAEVKEFMAAREKHAMSKKLQAELRLQQSDNQVLEMRALIEATARAVLYIKDQVDLLVGMQRAVAPAEPIVAEPEPAESLPVAEPEPPSPFVLSKNSFVTPRISNEKKEKAAQLALQQGMSIRAAAESVGISSRTLRRYIEARTAPAVSPPPPKQKPIWSTYPKLKLGQPTPPTQPPTPEVSPAAQTTEPEKQNASN